LETICEVPGSSLRSCLLSAGTVLSVINPIQQFAFLDHTYTLISYISTSFSQKYVSTIINLLHFAESSSVIFCMTFVMSSENRLSWPELIDDSGNETNGNKIKQTYSVISKQFLKRNNFVALCIRRCHGDDNYDNFTHYSCYC